MSVWGWQFYDSAAVNDAQERARVDAMISRLVDYLQIRWIAEYPWRP